MSDISVNRDVALEILDLGRQFVSPTAGLKATHDYANVFAKCRDDIARIGGFDFGEARVLVLGCGYTYPEVILWSTIAREVVGIDTNSAFWRNGSWRLYQAFRDENRSIVQSILQTLHRRRESNAYLKELVRVANTQLTVHSQDILSYDGQQLPFKDNAFTIVSSNAVLEHVRNLDSVCSEMRRVTAQSGVNYHLWHNYYSFSGAHVKERFARSSPWGHLTGDKAVDSYLKISGTYLNKMTPSEIHGKLSQHFKPLEYHQVDRNHNKKGVDRGFIFEGEDELTDDLYRTLPPMSREIFLTRAYLFVGRKMR